MDLLKIIEEQSIFEFTGKVNMLLKGSNQFIGSLWQKDGVIVRAQIGKLKNKKALLRIIFDDLENPDKFHFVVEPELVSEDEFEFAIEYSSFYSELQRIYSDYQKTKKFRPPDNLRLIVNKNYINLDSDVTPEEFDILCLISDSGKVGDIYNLSPLYDFEITNILVSLRKKKAVEVLA